MIKKVIVKYENYFSVFFLLAFSLLINFFPNNLTEADNVLHISYASLYKNLGLFFSDFRWDNFSVFLTYKSDMWYGFHIILVPFVLGQNYLDSISLAGGFVTFVYTTSIFFVLKKTGARWPLFWSLFVIFITPNQYVRYTDLRPHVLISAIAVIFTYFSLWKESRWWRFGLSVLVAFLEVSLIWLLPLLAGIFFIWDLILVLLKKNFETFKSVVYRNLTALLWVVLGIIVGTFMRPNPIEGIYLFYYQIVYLYVLKFTGGILPIVSELQPMAMRHLQSSLPIIFLFCVSVIFWVVEVRAKEDEIKRKYVDAIIFTGVIFFIISVFSFRAFDFFIIFAFLLGPVVLTNKNCSIYNFFSGKLVPKFCVTAFVISVSIASLLGGMNFRKAGDLDINKYRGAATFLEKNTKEGSKVFLLTYNDYAWLYLWNKNNSYSNHSDEVFRRAFNPLVYEKFVCSLQNLGVVNEVWADLKQEKLNTVCPRYSDTDLVLVLSEYMDSKYLFVGRSFPVGAIKYLVRDDRAKVVYSDDNSIIFRLN